MTLLFIKDRGGRTFSDVEDDGVVDDLSLVLDSKGRVEVSKGRVGGDDDAPGLEPLDVRSLLKVRVNLSEGERRESQCLQAVVSEAEVEADLPPSA